MKRLLSSLWIKAALASALSAGPLAAQEEPSFYRGKTVTLIVGISAGGGYDQYARLLARHLPRHIPGEPTIVVRNMPGAGSLTSVLHLKNVAPPDGTQIGTFNAGLLSDSMSEGERAKLRFNEVAWLGSMAKDLRVCFVRKATNILTLDELLKRKETIFGASGVNSNSANGALMLRNLLKVNMRMISGYPGNTEMNLAFERGEVDGSCTTWTSIPEQWIKERSINVLLRLSANTTPEIPASAGYIGDLVKGDEQKSVVEILTSAGDLARPFVASKQTPPQRLATLRSGFAAATADGLLLADAARLGLSIDPIDGAAATRIVERLYAFPPDLVEKARNAIKE